MKQVPDIDLRYAKDLLDRINTIHIKGTPIAELCVFGEYNIWHCYQMNLLFRDIKEYSRYKNTQAFEDTRLESTLRGKIQGGIVSCFFLLWSLLSMLVLIIARYPMLVFSIDQVSSKQEKCDFRIEALYTFLHKRNIRYMGVFRANFGIATFANLLKRKRLGIYRESFNMLFPLVRFFVPYYRRFDRIELSHTDTLSNDELDFVQLVVPRYLADIPRFEMRTVILGRLLRLSGVKTVLSIDDTRNYYELMLASSRNGIATYAFQHGHFTKYHVGWLRGRGFSGRIISPDFLIVWSEYWRNELLRLGTYFSESQLIVGGALRETQAPNVAFDSPKNDEMITVVYPYEIDAYKREVREHLKKLCACGNVQVYFKLRQDIDKNLQYDEYGLAELLGDRLHVVTYLEEIQTPIHLVVGTYSTFLYHMIEAGIPVSILEGKSDFGEGMLYHGIASRLSSDNICQSVYDAALVTDDELNRRREKLTKGATDIYQTLSQLIMSEIYVEKN